MPDSPRRTALFDTHVSAGGRMVDFAGWNMPVWFEGIGKEHLAVRERVGMFDVSHMGQVLVRGPDALRFVDYLVTNDVIGLPAGRALYTPMCQPDGGIVDDLIVYKMADNHLLLCVNAGTTPKDVAHIRKYAQGDVTIADVSDDYSQIAVQGPRAYDVLARVWPDVASQLNPFDFIMKDHEGCTVMVAGTGYTGERGYELYVPWASGPTFWNLFMEAGQQLGIAPIGLGARDTLRLEARFCLYGNDIDETTNPLEAGLKWTVCFDRDFLGREALLATQEKGLTRRLAGFKMVGKGLPKPHLDVYHAGQKVGQVTSGTRSPTLGVGLGLAYLDVPYHKRKTLIEIEIRGKMVAAKVVKTPFYKAAPVE
jgi:aminomethyltransferase